MNSGNNNTSLTELIQYNKTILNAILSEKLSTFQYLGYTFDTTGTKTSSILMNGQYADLSISGGFIWPVDFVWADITGTNISMTALQAVQFAATLFSYTQLCNTVYNNHLLTITTSTDINTLNNYDVTANWPIYGTTYNDAIAGALYQNSRRPQVSIITAGTSNAMYTSTTSTTYFSARRFSFRGTNNSGIPTAIKSVAYISSNTKSGKIRIQDITNSVTICEAPDFNNISAAIINLGAISNLSTDEAIWEVQIKSSNATNTTYLNSVNIYF
jgi:hypothetical protein